MNPLPAGVAREAAALLRAGRGQEARALIGAWPGMTPDQVQKLMEGLAIGNQTRAEASLRIARLLSIIS
jgi:hypothetical protein